MKSFVFAFQGLKELIVSQKNFRIHLLAMIVVIFAAWFFGLTQSEWIAILLCGGLVLTMEAINTALEYVVNFISPDKHPSAKRIKDIAAGAVLLAALMALVVGLLIFVPYIQAEIS